MFWIGLICGVYIGIWIGLFVSAMCVAADAQYDFKNADEMNQEQ